jgi:hypothetical protein
VTIGGLIAPEGDDELFDCEDEALALKPVMTGDVFVGVIVPGEPDPVDLMIAGHPCTIRRGAVLAERVPCARIVRHQSVPYERWPSYDKNHFPLSSAARTGEARCVALWDWLAAPAGELLRSRRRATLQDQGIYIFLQRLIHSLSRFAPPLSVLREASGHVLAEAELEYSWMLELFEEELDSEDMRSLIGEFDSFMAADDRRALLRADRKRVASQVSAEIARRQAMNAS